MTYNNLYQLARSKNLHLPTLLHRYCKKAHEKSKKIMKKLKKTRKF